MKSNVKLILGGVYKTTLSDGPCRIIGFDDNKVFYDPYKPALNKWSFSSRSGSNCTYYRTWPEVFLKNAKFLEELPLTPDELRAYRPDLPFRLCQNKTINWTKEQFPELEDYKNYLRQISYNFSEEIVLPVTSIALRPFGQKGTITALKSKVVSSLKSTGFSCVELLWLSHNLQAPHLRELSNGGVGIFRSGHKKNMPSYFIGGYHSDGKED